VSDDVALMPATLNKKSSFFEPRISETRDCTDEREELEDASTSMMWMFLWLLRAERSEWSVDVLRMPAMMVLSVEEASWRTNSRPRPRFAPVRKYVGIFVVFLEGILDVERYLKWAVLDSYVVLLLPRMLVMAQVPPGKVAGGLEEHQQELLSS
jgi:hypothetical protein